MKLLGVVAAGLLLASCGGPKGSASNDDDGAPAAKAAPPAVSLASITVPTAATPAATASAAGAATSLGADDQKLSTGQYYDAYPLPIAAGEIIDITVAAKGFKPVLVILDPQKQKLSETTTTQFNADGTWTLSFSDDFAEAGDYFVIVAAEAVGATGTYETTLNRGHKIG